MSPDDGHGQQRESSRGVTTPKWRFRGWIFPIALINFIVFFVVAMSLGGDACNGTQIDGHYYVANHGHLTEVSLGVYVYSLCHATSVVFTHLAALATGYTWLASSRRKRT
jgi:hypothetical protein